MSKVAVITDSGTCLPPDVVREFGLFIVPLALTIDGQGYRDQVDISPGQFWKRFATMQKVTTGGPPPGDFARAFIEAGESTDDIVCTMVARAMSVTFDSAVRARDYVKAEYPRLKIEVIDSGTAIGAVGFIALEAARAALAGGTLSEVVRVMRDVMGRVRWMNALESPGTVAKFGRVPGSVAGARSQGMPIIGQVGGLGRIEDLGRAPGKQECFQRMVEIIGEKCEMGGPLHVMVHYSNRIEDGKRLLRMVKSRHGCAEAYLTPYSPAMAATAGPSTGIAFW